ncbi:MAG: protein kinase, partial [Anaerolineae bacterium]|nr:protein kinase [Anaerolineae bacterium]
MTSALLGTTLSDRYRFEQLLGAGTFAEVYRVTDLRRRATLAAKVLRSAIARDQTLLERFQREAIVLARLQHPNIVRFYDIVEQNGYTFILIDYVPGNTLADMLKTTTKPVRPHATLDIITPLAAALHFAHTEGVIHRDLKPANILLHENGTVLVTDFGIARLLNVTSELTLGATIGTPLYMAPEQITGDPVTVATDIYALGTLLYRMVTGRVPFRGDHPASAAQARATRITYEHVHVTPPPPTTLNPKLDLAVQEIILRCLEKDPSRRYTSVSALYDALAESVGAPPVAIHHPATDDDTNAESDAPVARPDMTLPEWSQFMPRVTEDATPANTDEATDKAAPPAQPHIAQTMISQGAVAQSQIEHPAPQPETQPHLEDALREAERTIANQPRPAEPTLHHAGKVAPPARPTLRHIEQPQPPATPPPAHMAPPQDDYGYYDDYDYPPARNWTFIIGIVSALLILVTLCLGSLYILGFFDTGSSGPDAAADALTKTVVYTAANTIPPNATLAFNPTRTGGTRIAFDSRRSGNLDIYIIDIDGTGLRQLTGMSGAERGPTWSPDGAQIAFYGASDENSNYDIYVINVDGTGLRNLTNSPSIDDKYPTWSPDGTQLAFHSNLTGDFDIYVINANGTELHPVTNNNADDLGPDWSPDGTQIVYHTGQWDFPYEIAVL